MNTLNDRKYTKSDEWVKLDGNLATIGVSDYAQDALSDVVFFEAVVSAGDTISANHQIATLESVKAAADVNSPVTGKISAINDALASSPELVNTDPYGKAWMVKIEIDNPAELDNLMDAAAYDAYCAGRSH
jgi:glycine cleavage system H protein